MTETTHPRDGLGDTAPTGYTRADRMDGRFPSDGPAAGGSIGAFRPAALLRLMRPHQWVKNVFVAAPLLLAPVALVPANLWVIALGFLAFSLTASAVYVLNDYADREADRLHPTKCRRPLACGEVTPTAALSLLGLLAVGGLGIAFALHPTFGFIVAIYFAMNIGYSFGLKDQSIIDVLIIAAGFLLRVAGGLVLVQGTMSVWILSATGLLALFLALAKRRDDLVRSLATGHRRSLTGYSKPFLDTAMTVVLAALLITYINYTNDADVIATLGTPQLSLTVPFVVAGILRYLQICLVEERSGAPTRIVLTDRFLITVLVLWALTFSLLVHL